MMDKALPRCLYCVWKTSRVGVCDAPKDRACTAAFHHHAVYPQPPNRKQTPTTIISDFFILFSISNA